MRRLLIAAAVAALCLPIAGAAAQRQIVQSGNVRVSFDGRLAPRALPRERLAPVTVHLDGSVATVDGTRPPQLREISVAVNRAGRLSTAGLPSCPPSRLQQTSTEAALHLCRGALVGHGRFAVNVDVSDSSLIPAKGAVLVFNSSTRKGSGMVLHLYGTTPVKAAFVLPFEISRRSRGEFGTVFTAKIPTLASDLGYVTDIEADDRAQVPLRRRGAQLPQRPLRRAGRLPGGGLRPGQGHLHLPRRQAADQQAARGLQGPVATRPAPRLRREAQARPSRRASEACPRATVRPSAPPR